MAKGMVNDLFEQVMQEDQQKQQNGQKNGGSNGKNGDKKKMSSFTLQKFYEKNQQLKDSGEASEATAIHAQVKSLSGSEELELTTGDSSISQQKREPVQAESEELESDSTELEQVKEQMRDELAEKPTSTSDKATSSEEDQK